MGYAFTALLEREGRLLPVTFGACNYEEAERVAPEIAASLRGKLKDLKLTTGLPPVTVKPTFPEPVFAPRAPRPTMLHAA